MIELSTSRSAVVLDPEDGGRIVSLMFDDEEVLAGASTPAVPRAMRTGSFPMVPFAGRLPMRPLTFDAQEYEFESTLDGVPAHGLAFDQPWHRAGSHSMAIDLAPLWAFGGRAEQHFELAEDHLTVTVVLSNDDRTMPGMLGFHPWFSRVRRGVEAELDFSPRRQIMTAEDGAPVWSPQIAPRPWDSCFAATGEFPALRWETGESIAMESYAPWCVIYEADPAAICLEPLTATIGALAGPNPPTVSPGRPMVLEMTIRFHPGS